jgi:predicted CopG family antitoxin
VSKNIAISDDVYRKLKREKGERSFSEVIEDRLNASSRLADVTGQRILDDTTVEAVREDVERLSAGTLARLDEGSETH